MSDVFYRFSLILVHKGAWSGSGIQIHAHSMLFSQSEMASAGPLLGQLGKPIYIPGFLQCYR